MNQLSKPPVWFWVVAALALVQMAHSLLIANSTAVYGPGAVIMPVMVMVIGILLVWLARSATSKGWLR